MTVGSRMGRAEQQHLDWLARSLGRRDYAPITGADVEVIRRVGDVVSTAPGSLLFEEGGQPDAVFFVERGEVEVYRGSGSRRRVVARAGAGSVLGDIAAFGDEPHPFTARALGPVTVLRLDRSRLLPEVALHPAMLMRWLVAGQRQLAATQRRVIELMHKNVLSQVADILVEESGHAPEVRLSQETIANLLGVSRQSVNEALARLKDQGLVSTGYRAIRVLDAEGLARVAR